MVVVPMRSYLCEYAGLGNLLSGGALDLINAIASLGFVWGYRKKKPWRMWLGTLTLTVSVYAAGIYTYWTIASGAWAGDNMAVYLIVNGGFLPVVFLWLLSCYWGARGQGSEPHV